MMICTARWRERRVVAINRRKEKQRSELGRQGAVDHKREGRIHQHHQPTATYPFGTEEPTRRTERRGVRRDRAPAGGGGMCEGRRPAWAAGWELRRREAAADAQLAAARARLAEALAELERARARAAELQRRLEQTYGKRRRLVEEARGRIYEIRAQPTASPPPPHADPEAEPDPSAATSSSSS
ncbi:hypothetical protein GQ55_9G054700 [Panicum hallii var. hallii]|uniref:Uncharacterized protein n=1 Tax=Panicum hallii var. hallii TaxID=1504633 RepID=A0A2T7BZX0_9POAL|nr:hypothetical protein GQ55_9G054700 [Panicum hallii var. hallii]PUZ36645.1 hypothetical protein GQ55_9G054700 [Panicum hallii var. hallii]